MMRYDIALWMHSIKLIMGKALPHKSCKISSHWWRKWLIPQESMFMSYTINTCTQRLTSNCNTYSNCHTSLNKNKKSGKFHFLTFYYTRNSSSKCRPSRRVLPVWLFEWRSLGPVASCFMQISATNITKP